MKLEKSEYYAGIIDKGTLDAIASGGNVEHVSNEHNMLNADWSEQHMSHEERKEQITFILMGVINFVEIVLDHTTPHNTTQHHTTPHRIAQHHMTQHHTTEQAI